MRFLQFINRKEKHDNVHEVSKVEYSYLNKQCECLYIKVLIYEYNYKLLLIIILIFKIKEKFKTIMCLMQFICEY